MGAIFMTVQPSSSYGYLSTVAKANDVKYEVFNDDPCQSHLQEVIYSLPADKASPSQMSEKNITQKSRAAAAGILFGVKYALGPKKHNRDMLTQGEQSRAQAVKNYRSCQKRLALEALRQNAQSPSI